MKLSRQETWGAWWRGAAKGALGGLVMGAVLGLAGAVLLYYAAASVLPVFMLDMIANAGVFNPWPLTLFSASSFAITKAITDGGGAVKEYHQSKHNMMYDARISALEGREQILEEALNTSQTVKKILAHGAVPSKSFAESLEESRDQAAQEKSHTLH
jgi:hypothetical protein